MKQRAYAKINLSLDVFAVREDGYHDIRSIMVPISLFDELELDIADKDSYSCNRPNIVYNENNSIVKMIKAFQDMTGIVSSYAVRLHKCVPIKAGLGGGTADGAAALKLLQKLHHVSLNEQQIIELCLKVGADVPFNYFNVPAIVEGIGEKITPIAMKKNYFVLLMKPYTGISTAEAYRKLDVESCDHPDVGKLKKALETGSSISGLLGNSLEQPSLLLNKDIAKIKYLMKSRGGKDVLMSGSGSSVFTISEDRRLIMAMYDALKDSGHYVRFVKTLNKKIL